MCGAAYKLERGQAWWIGQGFTVRHWLQTASLVFVICLTIACSWAVIQMFDDAFIRSLTAGASLLILYVCTRYGVVSKQLIYYSFLASCASLGGLLVLCFHSHGNCT